MGRFGLVITLYIAIYGGMTWLVLSSLVRVLALRGIAVWICNMWGALMVVSPLLLRRWDGLGHSELRHIAAWIAYVWMGFVFFAFCLLLLFFVFRILFWRRRVALSDLGLKCCSSIALFLAFLCCLLGYSQAWDIKVNYIKVETAKLPPEWPYVRVAQISDIHLGLIVREDRLKKIVEAIEASSSHLVVSTGDLVDGQMDGRQKEIDLLQSLSAPLGKFAVTGNHEVYAGLNQATSFIEECGFQVIRNEVLNLAPLLLAGVDDDDIKMAESFSPSEQNLLSSLSPHRFRLFLKHRPIVMEDSIDFFDLQLSGHVHGGQMWPFTLVTRAVYPMGTGLHRLKNEVMLYVTSGAGTWGPPMRFLAAPEVAIIDIVNSETAKK